MTHLMFWVWSAGAKMCDFSCLHDICCFVSPRNMTNFHYCYHYFILYKDPCTQDEVFELDYIKKPVIIGGKWMSSGVKEFYRWSL